MAAKVPDRLKAKLFAIAAHRTRVEGRTVTLSEVIRSVLADYFERAISEEVDADLAREFGDDP